MKQLIEYIVSNIVNHPESVVITEDKTSEGDMIKYLIKVDPEDVGRVIGKQGKVIKSIRQIVRIAAIQKGVRAIVDLLEDETSETENPIADIETQEEAIEDEAVAEKTVSE